MKYAHILVLFLIWNLQAAMAEQSPAEVVLGYAEACWKAVAGDTSMSLSNAYHHGTKPGSKEEAAAKRLLDAFNNNVAAFPKVVSTTCTQERNNNDRAICYGQGYTGYTRRIVKTYGQDASLRSTPECAYILFTKLIS